MRITITQADLDKVKREREEAWAKGQEWDATGTCLVATAITRETGRKCRVGLETARFDLVYEYALLPTNISTLIREFMDGKYQEVATQLPVTFELRLL